MTAHTSSAAPPETAPAAPKRLRVFLSYARANKPRVAKIAAALEAAGIDVWWDHAIEAGSAFSDEIAHELETTDAIVVVWSKAAIASSWVRDEADVGRRRGRLVPVTIEPVQAPLGFRQLHVTDLCNWRGRPQDPAFRSVISAIERAAGGGAGRTPVTAAVGTPWRSLGLGLLALLLLGGLAFAASQYFGRRNTDLARPIVAVLPFTNMTEGGQPYFAQGLAEEILDTLARNKGLKVLGSASARTIRAKGSDPGFARRTLGVNWLLDGSVRGGANAGDRVKVSVQLIDTSDGSAVWAEAFDRRGADIISMQEEIAKAVESQISGSLTGAATIAAAPRAAASPEAFSKVVVARQLIRTRKADALLAAVRLADEAIALDGDYALAYATRASAAILGAIYAVDPQRIDRDVTETARRDAEKAIALDPNLSDGFDALGLVLSYARDGKGAIAAAERAVALRPDNAEAQLHLAAYLAYEGQVARGIKAFQSASALDPMWVIPVAAIILNSEWINAPGLAKAVAARFSGLAFDPALSEWLIAAEANARGDYGVALRAAKVAAARDPELYVAELARTTAARALLASGNAASPAGESFAAASRRSATEAAEAGLSRGVGAWNEARVATAMAWALVHLGRDADLLRSFDARFASIEAYAAANVPQEQAAVPLAIALERQGRKADAAAMQVLAEKSLGLLEARGVVRSQTATSWAALELRRGNRDVALARLTQGAAQQWWAVCRGPVWIGSSGPLAPLRGDPQFATLVRDCATRINQQRKAAGLPALAESGE